MKIRLEVDLPIEKIHGATKGRVFDVIRLDGNRAVFAGDAGFEVTALCREYEIEKGVSE